MFPVLRTELTKLHRSLALLLIVAAPGLVAVFMLLNGLRDGMQQPWAYWPQGASAIWAFFMLPMSVTALTALVAHMEHGPKSWDHLRALPVARWKLYAAKAICVVAVVGLMSMASPALTWLAVQAAVAIKPQIEPTGVFELGRYAATLGQMFVAGLLLVAVQLWTALRYASFVPGLVLGIGGTFFSVVATASKQGAFLPWQMPVNVLMGEGWRLQAALGLGGGLGLVALALMVAHLSRREVL